MKPRSEAPQYADRFLLGHAEAPEWEKAAEQCLQQIGYVPPEASLGFLYTTDSHAGLLPRILDHFREETGIRDWVGTVGMGICASGREYHETGAMSVMIGSFPEDAYRVLPALTDPTLPGLAALEPWLARSTAHVAVVHGDPRNAATPEIVQALARRLPGGHLVGGLSASRDEAPQIANAVVQGGVSGVVFDAEQVRVATGLTQGCTPIAGTHRITGCERNIISHIDGRPALDVLFEDIGEILARDLNRIAGYIFAGLPLEGSDTADYLVRNLVGVDTDHRLLAIGDLVEPGQSIRFCRRDGRTAWEDLGRMLTELQARVGSRPIRGGLYFSCLGRGQNLFGDDSEELRFIRQQLGDFPLTGFFANGEISHDRLYGYTGVLTLFLGD